MPEFLHDSSPNRMYRMKKLLHIPLAAVAFAIALSLFMPMHHALAEGSFLNTEVQVDVSGKDAADAREQAMAKAQQEGLQDLLSKLTSPDQVQLILTNLDADRIASIVSSTEVLDEKITSNRYRARLMMSYDGDEISRMIDGDLGNTNISIKSSVGSFLIIPGYQEDGKLMLWDETNPWRSAFRMVGLEIGSGDIVVPYGDSRDSAIVNASTMSYANYASLVPLTVRYGVSDVVIVKARYTHTPDPQIEVVKRRINRTQNEVSSQTFRADPSENKQDLMLRVARDIASQILHKKVEELETVKSVQGGDHHTVMMLASISTLRSWTELRERLKQLPMIDKLEMIAIAPQQVDMIVHFRGAPKSLAQALSAKNIRLIQNQNYWVISRD